MEFNITPVIEALIGLCAAVLTAVLIPWLRARYGDVQFNKMLAWVEVAVAAAEQIYTAVDGDLKKEYVLRFLSQKGYRVDELDIDYAIEAAVLRLHSELYPVEVIPHE